MDIVTMLEGPPPQPQGRQGSRELNRCRPSEREHLSPGLTNGKTAAQNLKVQKDPYAQGPTQTANRGLPCCFFSSVFFLVISV